MEHERHDAARHDLDEKKAYESDVNAGLPPTLKGTQVGIWRVITERESDARAKSASTTEPVSWSRTQLYTDPVSTVYALAREARIQVEATHIPRLVMDTYRLGPALFWVMILSYTLTGMEDALLLWLNNRVMSLVCSFHSYKTVWLTRGRALDRGGHHVLRPRLSCDPPCGAVPRWRGGCNFCLAMVLVRSSLIVLPDTKPTDDTGAAVNLSSKAARSFTSRSASCKVPPPPLFSCTMQLIACTPAHLSQDLTQSREASLSIEASPLNSWFALSNLMGTLDVVVSTLSSLALLANLVLLPSAGAGTGAGSLLSGLLADGASKVTGNATGGADGSVRLEGATASSSPASVANTLIVLALCMTWPLASQMLKRDLDNKSACLPSSLPACYTLTVA